LYIETCPGEALDIFNHQHRSLTLNHTTTNDQLYVRHDIASCSGAVARVYANNTHSHMGLSMRF